MSESELHIPLDTSYSRPFHLVGTNQNWIERMGVESDIPVIPARIARRGRMYGAGGSIIQVESTLAAGESILFEKQISTKGYPPGEYTYYIEYAKVRGETLQMQSVDFELDAN